LNSLDTHELINGLALLACGGIVLYPLWRRMVRTHRRDRAMRAMAADPKLSDLEQTELRIAEDLDTVVIKQEKVNKALGRVGGVAPKLRRTEIQPRRHRYDPELDTPRRLLARNIETPR
jgi:hypothetical protein